MNDVKNVRSEIEKLYPDLVKFTKKNDLEFFSIFFTTKLNSIEKKPRSVEISTELKLHRSYSLFQKEISIIKDKFEQGKSLLMHLSKNISDRDFLLRDLAIHHLHLSDFLKNNHKTKRTDELLLIHISDHCVYFIDIATHDELFKKGHRKRTVFLEIIDMNWPHILKPYIMNNLPVPDKGHDFTDDEKAELLANGGCVMFSVNGKVLSPPGGSSTTSGAYLRALDLASNLRAKLFGVR